MNWSRLTINLDPETAKAAKNIARKQRRSFAAYVATLIERDLAAATPEAPEERLVAEDKDAYGPTVDDLARAEQRRRQAQGKSQPGRGGAPKAPAKSRTARS